jgi:uncharacterized secreted protein with C-terminal beta-propeller domain
MNKLFFLAVCLLGLCHLTPSAAAQIRTTDGSSSLAEISLSLTTPNASPYAKTFSTSDPLQISFTLTIDPADIGRKRKLYLAALYNGQWFMFDSHQNWQPWDGDLANLTGFEERILTAEEQINAVSQQSLFNGEFVLYAGYANHSGGIIYNAEPLSFYVFEPNETALKPFYTGVMLEDYLRKTLQIPNNSPLVDSGGVQPAEISTTNLQEIGVDEADSIKTDNNQLYVLTSCDPNDQSANCIKHYQLSDNPAEAKLLDSTSLAQDVAADSLYLSNEHAGQPATLISIGSHQNNIYSIMPTMSLIWHDPRAWQDTRIDAVFYNVTDTGLTQTHRIGIDGTLISSRRVNGTLYLITRLSPSPEQLLPNINIDGVKHTLSEAKNCYLPPSTAAQYPEASIITIAALSVDEPTQFSSRCIVGQTETIYMSPKNIYLATTRYPYITLFEPELLSVATLSYLPDHTTQLHKFSLDGLNIDYRGSGEVKGHLGWETDKKPFRMGEYNGILRIATSIGDNWSDNASTSLSVLQEENQTLREIGRLDNLGKPGERLYAARFIENRGFLVTFRITDPLYILDLADPTQPKIAGELEINGYSDYLHPISENFLLGIGKDAIADTNATDNGGRGAWYQGIKLSLFDISNPAMPREVDQLVLGKRGSETDALYDHHALAYLPPQNGAPARLALPVRLHDGVPFGDIASADTYYDWSSTGLHVFDIDIASVTPLIQKVGQIITEQAPAQSETFFTWSDRAVLQGQTAHYIHAGAVYSEQFE